EVPVARPHEGTTLHHERTAPPARESVFVGEIESPRRELSGGAPVLFEEEDPGAERRGLSDRERSPTLLGKGQRLGLYGPRPHGIPDEPPSQALEGTCAHNRIDAIGPICVLQRGGGSQRLGEERRRRAQTTSPAGDRPAQEMTLQCRGGAETVGHRRELVPDGLRA